MNIFVFSSRSLVVNTEDHESPYYRQQPSVLF